MLIKITTMNMHHLDPLHSLSANVVSRSAASRILVATPGLLGLLVSLARERRMFIIHAGSKCG